MKTKLFKHTSPSISHETAPGARTAMSASSATRPTTRGHGCPRSLSPGSRARFSTFDPRRLFSGVLCAEAVLFAAFVPTTLSAAISLETAPPVVVRTQPVAGSTNVDPRTSEIVVQFSKPMQDGSWSWSTWGEENFPETTGQPRYGSDGKTCVLPVKLEPGKFYATWLNSEKFGNFKDRGGRSAVPYLLTFTTGSSDGREGASQPRFQERLRPIVRRAQADARDELSDVAVSDDQLSSLLNDDQKAVIAWTDRQFRSYWDERNFAGWSAEEIESLEKRMIDALNGPRSREYYTAINTLGALRSTNALPRLRELAFERVDKNNRDRWMAVRVLGLMGDRESIPNLIHLVYHGNQNTHWWAQITLVRLTGQNFAGDWEAWGKWWNESGGQPPYNPEIIRWWDGQAEDDKLAESLAESNAKFLQDIRAK